MPGLLAALLAPTVAAAPVTLNVGAWACSDAVWQKAWCNLYREFEAQHPDVKVVANALKSTGGPQAGGEGLLVQIASGEVPDLVIMADTTLAEFAGAGALTDVSAEIKAGNIDPNDYWSAAWEAAQYEGRYWGVPFVTATRALDYNTELFAQAGYAEPPHTLSELETAAQKLTIKSGNGDYKQFGFWPDGGNWFIWGWGWLFGGRYYDPATHTITADDPRVVEALSWEVTYARRYQKGAGGFCNGSLAMQIDNSPVMSSYLANCPGLRYDTAPVPPPADGQKATWSGVWMLAIPKGAKHPELARELIRFLSTDAVQQEFALAVTQIPTRKRAVGAVLPAMVQRYGHPAQVFLDLMPFTHVRPVLPIANLYWSKLIEAHDAAMSLKKTPKAALSDVTKDLQGRLDALIKQP